MFGLSDIGKLVKNGESENEEIGWLKDDSRMFKK